MTVLLVVGVLVVACVVASLLMLGLCDVAGRFDDQTDANVSPGA